METHLIERLLEIDGPADWVNTAQVAAYHIEAQQRELRVKDATIGQMANDMAAAQAQIKVLREALDSSFSKWGGYAAAKKRIEVAIEAMEHAEDYLRNCANSPVEAYRLKDAIRAMGSES